MKAHASAWAEVALDAFDEAGLRVEPRDLVLVLVGEHAEVVARDGVQQRLTAGPHALLDGGEPRQPRPIALGVSAILIADEEHLAPRDGFGQGCRHRLY